MDTFEATDIYRQMVLCNMPTSSLLYVENLWERDRDMRRKLKQLENLIETFLLDSMEIIGE